MSALSEMQTMAADGVSVDIITAVLRSHYSEEEIAHAYTDLLTQGWQVQSEAGSITFHQE